MFIHINYIEYVYVYVYKITAVTEVPHLQKGREKSKLHFTSLYADVTVSL